MSPRRSLIVAGFLGRGNCGDEAMFQVIHAAFAPTFDIIASVDEHGAYPAFWDWHPYNACRIVHQIDAALFEPGRAPAGLIVGGGGLGFGFAGNQVIAARCFGVKTAFAGTDMPKLAQLAPGSGIAAAQTYLSMFDYIGLRNARGVEQAATIGISAHHAADWALALPTDTSPEVTHAPDEILITLREYPRAMITPEYLLAVDALLSGLRARGRRPVLLPFAPEDECFLADHALATTTEIRRAWWNPARMKQLIAASGGLISIGRLHPVIFAASARIPVAAIAPPVPGATQGRITSKVQTMCTELGIYHLPDVPALLAAIDAGAFTASNPRNLATGEHRLAEMLSSLHHLFDPARP